MDASILDLRYKMRSVLTALNRRERVRVLYHGKVKGEIIPIKGKGTLTSSGHPLFGMLKGEEGDPADIVSNMRRRRYDDL